ncbi:MAG: hypothetical protein WBQ43_20090 [Terriglobales bacterium]
MPPFEIENLNSLKESEGREFPATAGSKVRGRVTLASAKQSPEFVDATFHVHVETESSSKLCCVAQWLIRCYPQ